MRTTIFALALTCVPFFTFAGIYIDNQPVTNDSELSYLNEFVGKFIVRSVKNGENGSAISEFDNCTATLISSSWILTSAHCVFVQPNVRTTDPEEMRFARDFDGSFEFYELTGRTVMGKYPFKAHEDWIFLELSTHVQSENMYPTVIFTDLDDWTALDGNIKNVTYLTYVYPDGVRDGINSNQLKTPENYCETGAMKTNVLNTLPEKANSLNWVELDSSKFGLSNCPSNLTSSGSPLFDRQGRIRAINSWQQTRYTEEYFGEFMINAHLLSETFFREYEHIIMNLFGN